MLLLLFRRNSACYVWVWAMIWVWAMFACHHQHPMRHLHPYPMPSQIVASWHNSDVHVLAHSTVHIIFPSIYFAVKSRSNTLPKGTKSDTPMYLWPMSFGYAAFLGRHHSSTMPKGTMHGTLTSIWPTSLRYAPICCFPTYIWSKCLFLRRRLCSNIFRGLTTRSTLCALVTYFEMFNSIPTSFASTCCHYFSIKLFS